MSENLKLRIDPISGESQQDKLTRTPTGFAPADGAPIDDAESQMRKALGLLGEPSRHRPDTERTDGTLRAGGERFNGGLHRRRFVQDGDVPVTVLRRDQGIEAPVHRSPVPSLPPQTSRLQRTEAALAAETAAREKAERMLSETQSIVRDLQTKIGHAELARNEAIEALRNEREVTAYIRAAEEDLSARLREAIKQAETAEGAAQMCQEQLLEERQARKAAEKALRNAEAARDAAEQLVRTLSQEALEARPAPAVKSPPPRAERAKPEPARRWPVAEPEVVAATARRRSQVEPTAEPEPVKWWLNSKPATKRK